VVLDWAFRLQGVVLRSCLLFWYIYILYTPTTLSRALSIYGHGAEGVCGNCNEKTCLLYEMFEPIYCMLIRLLLSILSKPPINGLNTSGISILLLLSSHPASMIAARTLGTARAVPFTVCGHSCLRPNFSVLTRVARRLV
jgi:hypothetical protein